MKRQKFKNYWRWRPQLILEISSEYIRAGFVDDPELISTKNIVALGKDSNEVIASGQLASQLKERVNEKDFKIAKPLNEGKIAHPQILEYLLQDIAESLANKKLFIWQKPDIFVVLSDTDSDIERAAYRQILQQITPRKINFVSSLAASAVASGLILSNDQALIVKLGFSKSLVGIVAPYGQIKVTQDLRVSANELIKNLRSWLRAENGVEVSYQACEKLFWQVLHLQNNDNKRKITFRGRGIHNGLPVSLTCVAGEANRWLEIQLTDKLARPLEQYIDELPAKLRADVLARGIYLSGELANLTGLDKWLKQQLRCYCRKTTQPDIAGVEGARLLLNQGESTWQDYVS